MKHKKKYCKQRVEQLEKQIGVLIERPESTEAKVIAYRHRLAKQMKAVWFPILCWNNSKEKIES